MRESGHGKAVFHSSGLGLLGQAHSILPEQYRGTEKQKPELNTKLTGPPPSPSDMSYLVIFSALPIPGLLSFLLSAAEAGCDVPGSLRCSLFSSWRHALSPHPRMSSY